MNQGFFVFKAVYLNHDWLEKISFLDTAILYCHADQMKKWFVRVAIGLLVVVLLLVLGVWYFLKSGCGANVLERFPSPSGNLTAVVYNYDCGATTGFSTQISIVDSEETPNSASDTFVIDDDHGKVSSTYSQGGPIVRVSWLSENQLSIAYPKMSRVFKEEKNAEDVQIQYSDY